MRFESMEFQVGQTIDPGYCITGRMGVSGVCSMYRAEHPHTGVQVAIKILRWSLSRDRRVVRRFLDRMRAARAIRHPSIATVHHAGIYRRGERHTAYTVMEFLGSDSLEARVRKTGPIPVNEAVSIARQIADALAAVHDRGVTHGDLKPDSVILVRDSTPPSGHDDSGSQRVKLTDVGMDVWSLLGLDASRDESCRATSAGRADLQALGRLLVTMLSGGPGPWQTAVSHDLERLIQCLLQINRPGNLDSQYPDAAAVSTILQQIVHCSGVRPTSGQGQWLCGRGGETEAFDVVEPRPLPPPPIEPEVPAWLPMPAVRARTRGSRCDRLIGRPSQNCDLTSGPLLAEHRSPRRYAIVGFFVVIFVTFLIGVVLIDHQSMQPGSEISPPMVEP